MFKKNYKEISFLPPEQQKTKIGSEWERERRDIKSGNRGGHKSIMDRSVMEWLTEIRTRVLLMSCVKLPISTINGCPTAYSRGCLPLKLSNQGTPTNVQGRDSLNSTHLVFGYKCRFGWVTWCKVKLLESFSWVCFSRFPWSLFPGGSWVLLWCHFQKTRCLSSKLYRSCPGESFEGTSFP